ASLTKRRGPPPPRRPRRGRSRRSRSRSGADASVGGPVPAASDRGRGAGPWNSGGPPSWSSSSAGRLRHHPELLDARPANPIHGLDHEAVLQSLVGAQVEGLVLAILEEIAQRLLEGA